MSKAKICDRCKKVYPVDHGGVYKHRPLIIKEGYDFGKDTIYDKIDICPECGKAFYEFMKNVSEEDDEATYVVKNAFNEETHVVSDKWKTKDSHE